MEHFASAFSNNCFRIQRSDKKDAKKEEAKTPFVGTIRIGMPPVQPMQPGQMTVPPPVAIRPQVQVALISVSQNFDHLKIFSVAESIILNVKNS